MGHPGLRKHLAELPKSLACAELGLFSFLAGGVYLGATWSRAALRKLMLIIRNKHEIERSPFLLCKKGHMYIGHDHRRGRTCNLLITYMILTSIVVRRDAISPGGRSSKTRRFKLLFESLHWEWKIISLIREINYQSHV